MRVFVRHRRALLRSLRRFVAETEASQILEFAVVLPLLLVLVVGIFDFSQAFNLKQKLNNAVREGARFAASLPTDDLSNPTSCGTLQLSPASICSVHDLVAAYLLNSRINDCGLSSQGASATAPWTYVASGNGCPAGGALTLTIDRSYAFPANIGGVTEQVISTQVTISYPYQWHFGKVIPLLVPGASYAGTTQISTGAVVPNTD